MPRILTDRQHNIDVLLRLYNLAHKRVVGELERLQTEANIARQNAILANIDKVLGATAAHTKTWAEKNVPLIYKSGADQVVRDVIAAKAPIKVAIGFGTPHVRAIQVLTERTFVDFASGLTAVKRSARAAVTEATRLKLRDELGAAAIQGETRNKTAAAIKNVLQRQGTVALEDRGGKQWQLDTYAQMLARTKHREIYNTGTSNRAVENGYDLVQIDRHGATDSCQDWEGEILSLTGSTPGYTTLQEAEDSEDHIFGPNCRHSYAVYVSDLARRTTIFRPGVDRVDENGRFVEE